MLQKNVFLGTEIPVSILDRLLIIFKSCSHTNFFLCLITQLLTVTLSHSNGRFDIFLLVVNFCFTYFETVCMYVN